MHLTTMPRVGEILNGLTVGALMIDQQTGQPYALLVSHVRPDGELERLRLFSMGIVSREERKHRLKHCHAFLLLSQANPHLNAGCNKSGVR